MSAVTMFSDLATLGFGLVHGLGLATKMLDFTLPWATGSASPR